MNPHNDDPQPVPSDAPEKPDAAPARLEGTLRTPAARKKLAIETQRFTDEGAPPPGFVGQHPPEVAQPEGAPEAEGDSEAESKGDAAAADPAASAGPDAPPA